MQGPAIIHHRHHGTDIVIRHTCVHMHSLCSTHTAHVHMHPSSCIACVYANLHMHADKYHSSRFICTQHFSPSFTCHCTALPINAPPPTPHLSVWEKPVGFVLSVTSCIFDVLSPEGEVPRFWAGPIIPYLSKCFSHFSIKQRKIRKFSGIKRK